MEALVNSRISPIRPQYRPQHCLSTSTFSLQLTKNSNGSRISIMNHPKSFTSVAASIQPVEASTLNRFNNTMPSQGYDKFLV